MKSLKSVYQTKRCEVPGRDIDEFHKLDPDTALWVAKEMTGLESLTFIE
ncbi:MAG: hypothetical protein JXI43_11685 [Tissierellales bacterium]|nr:hypothetical protein [Tissierellales bacterium]